MQKNKWSEDEDKIICKICVDEYVLKKGSLDIESCLDKIMSTKNFENHGRGSVRMRIQNIKAVLDDLKIPNTIPITALSNAATQTRKILLNLLNI